MNKLIIILVTVLWAALFACGAQYIEWGLNPLWFFFLAGICQWVAGVFVEKWFSERNR